MDFDVAIVGGGTAGSTAALNLAPVRRVIVIERTFTPAWRIGESIPGAMRRLLADMGLFDDFAADGHLPRNVFSSAWGGASPVMRDAIADPDGHGWQIDRAKFEQQLRAEAVRRGTVWEAPAKVVGVDFDGRRWAICCAKHGRDLSVSARILVDAAGRGSRCVAPKMTRKVIHDALCSTWLLARDVQLPGGTVQIEAEAGGWWYAAPLPNGLAVLAFHTDSDLPEARAVRAPGLLLERARALPLLGEVVAENAWSRAQFGYCAAHGAWLDRAAGDAWFAIGDAAISFDPLAGQGLFNAMYLGLSAAESADRLLSGEPEARIRYAAEVARVRDTYVARRAAWYQIEKRWASRPFWARRAAIADAHAAAQQTPQSPIGDGGEQRRERR